MATHHRKHLIEGFNLPFFFFQNQHRLVTKCPGLNGSRPPKKGSKNSLSK